MFLRILPIFCLMVFALAVHGADSETTLPVTLRILNFDQKLNSFLLSGDFTNDLSKPLRAWRGELRLKHTAGTGGEAEPVSFFFEHQAKRPVGSGETGVWSFWLDFKADVPEHVALKTMTTDTTRAELRLLRVLYEDGSQEAF